MGGGQLRMPVHKLVNWLISSLLNLFIGTSSTPLQYVIVDRLGAFCY